MNDPTVKISKKEKKAKKAEANGTVAAATSADSSKKEKKDKKRKRDEANKEAAATTTEPGVEDGEKKKKKKKKSKDTSVPAVETEDNKEAVVVVADEVGNTSVQADSTDKAEKKKKKKEKKSPKEAESSEQGATPAAASSVDLSSALASTADSVAFCTKHAITLTPTTYPIFLSLSTLPINPLLRPFLNAFKDPTPIQACSWPPLFEGKDVVGIAETGSGKTLSFGLPGLNLLSTSSPSVKASMVKGKPKSQIRLLVVAPTRELATQTFVTLQALGKLVGVGAVCLFGGVNKDGQIAELRKKETSIVVGTPGRVMDLADSGDVDFSG